MKDEYYSFLIFDKRECSEYAQIQMMISNWIVWSGTMEYQDRNSPQNNQFLLNCSVYTEAQDPDMWVAIILWFKLPIIDYEQSKIKSLLKLSFS